MLLIRAFSGGLVACLLCFSPATRALEPWADQNLPVIRDLEFWLDATRVNGAASEPFAGMAVNRWADGSGQRRDVAQEDPEFQPKLRSEASAAVAFDGTDDWLEHKSPAFSLEQATIFLVAAPASNGGEFRGLFSLNAPRQNDYTSGLTIDLGPAAGDRFNQLNVEGIGFGGAFNLRQLDLPLDRFELLAVQFGPSEVTLFEAGREGLRRPRQPAKIDAGEIRLGARYYRNSPGPKSATGFFHGQIAEVLVYSRVLPAQERQEVEAYLRQKHSSRLAGEPPGHDRPLESLLTPLVPGFVAQELPVDLTNVNALAYGSDGQLFALAYDGRVYALADTDGDGLEETVAPFWDRPTLRGPIALAVRPEGVYVTAREKIALLVDDDQDGKGDREEAVVSDWEPPKNYSGGVDALGLAFDRDNNLYFGLGCSDFTNAYLLQGGKSRYDLASERGTILKVSPDRKHREIVCTGIRFPVGLAFNAAGDLFATDQEGETWLPDGNPTDELNHIVPGRHYGFPPRHPDHLPAVVDEPAIVDFTPQHQSSCGLCFNEPVGANPPFGLEEWRGDVFVAGYSRGKIWRVRLAKTAGGYVGDAEVFAASRMLVVSVCLSPRGDLVVACHSGSPDWGSGPKGSGKLFRITRADPSATVPMAAWAEGPTRVRVSFNQPLDAEGVARWAGEAIAFGEHVRPGDALEVHRPGYQAVTDQMRAPRGKLRIAAAKLLGDARTVELVTDPHPARATYVLDLPIAPGSNGESRNARIAYRLEGVRARWLDEQNQELAAITLPHADPRVALHLASGSRAHGEWREVGKRARFLEMRTKIRLPDGAARIDWHSPNLAAVTAGGKPATLSGALFSVPVDPGSEPFEWVVTARATGGPELPPIEVAYLHEHDGHARPLKPGQLLLPWAPPAAPRLEPGTPVPTAPMPAALAAGDWNRGRAVFFGKEANCSACHLYKGEGGRIGPDLSNLGARDPGSVYRDITEPSAAIHPDYVSSVVVLADGRVLTGIARSVDAEHITVVDAKAAETIVPQAEVETIEPSPLSVMPKGFGETLPAAKLADLLVFLTEPPPTPIVTPPGAPQRSAVEVRNLLAALPAEPSADRSTDRPLNLVLLAGTKDHGPGEHDYPRWQKDWTRLLRSAPGTRISTAMGWPTAAQWDLADVIVMYLWVDHWTGERLAELDRFLDRGGGVVALHPAVIPKENAEELAKRLGLAWKPGLTKFRHGPLRLDVVLNHPITAGLTRVDFVDETYWPLVGEISRVRVLASANEEGAPHPMLWTHEREIPGDRGGGEAGGRVFGCVLGHYAATFEDPVFQTLILRGIAWAAREPEGRLQSLVSP